MDKHRTNALQYGHLGTAVYCPDTKEWDFMRRIEEGSSLTLVGHSELTVPPSLSLNHQSQPRNGGHHKMRQTAALAKTCPEVASSSKCLLENEARSQAITAATDTFDPRVSNLLALGNARFSDGNRIDSRTMPIAVVSWGESASSLRFSTLENKVTEELSPNILQANVPCITSRESGWWIGNGSPVRQICFSNAVEQNNTWMAVRFHRSTRIFRPLCHRVPVPARYADDESVHNISPNSRLDANPLVNIPISATGGYSHADVMMNPMYQRQIAIVDENGNWSVWEIQGRHRSNWRADKKHFGHLKVPDNEDEDETRTQERYDGWASVTWIGETDKLLVCDRRNATLYSFNSGSVKQCRVDLELERNSEWILDVNRSSVNESHLFVLTSSKILWLNVISREPVHQDGDESIEVSILLSWRHFRGLEDTSLRLSLLKGRDDVSLTLYSRLNQLVQTFRFSFSLEDDRPISVSDPSLLPLPLELEPQSNPGNTNHGLRISSLHFEDVDDCITPTPHGAPTNMKLVKMFAQPMDMSVAEALYLLPVSDNQEDDMLLREKRPTFLPKKSKRLRANSRTDDDIDNFVVDDLDESTVNSDLSRHWKVRNMELSTLFQQNLGLEDRWTFDFSSVYATITRQTGAVSEPKGSEYDFGTCIQEIKASLQEPESLVMTASPSLFDIADSTPGLNDIDLNAREFRDFLNYMSNEEIDPIGQYKYLKVDTQYPFKQLNKEALNPDSLPQLDITQIYDTLVRDWLATLPSEVPNKARIAKEKLVRGVAAELSLARVLVLWKPPAESNISELPDPVGSLSDDVKVSFHSNDEGTIKPNKSHGRSSSQPTMSQDYKLPSTQLSSMSNFSQFEPTSSFPSSLPSSQPSQPRTIGSPASRLRLYTTIDEQPTLSKDATNILSHWHPGSDPAAYDWQKTSQALEAEDAEQTRLSRTSSGKRKKREARKRMALQQQRLEQPGHPSDPLAGVPSSSAPIVRTMGSQSQGGMSSMSGFPQSSQMSMAGGFPSSQIELGSFSQQGRSGSKGKPKKKRAAGF